MVLALYILINVIYPTDNIDSVRMYNNYIDKAMKNYCFLDIEYDITNNINSDLILFPSINILNEETLGFTTSNYLVNPKISGIPKIYISNKLQRETDIIQILTHELGHFLGLEHSIDENSLMYPYYYYTVYNLSRQDSLLLKRIYNLPQN
jgi:hypothetical protein